MTDYSEGEHPVNTPTDTYRPVIPATIVSSPLLPLLSDLGTVYHVFRDGVEDWDGSEIYANQDSALLHAAREVAEEEYGLDPVPAGALAWRDNHGWWDLLHDGQTTGVIVQARTLYGKATLPKKAGDDV